MPELEDLSQEEAAAELYLRALKSTGPIDTAWRKEGTNVVCATTHGDGPHLGNLAADFDADVHLICETPGVRRANNVPSDIPDDDHGPVFFNVAVHGIADDLEGYSLPTHAPQPEGAYPRTDLDPELASIARTAGVPLGVSIDVGDAADAVIENCRVYAQEGKATIPVQAIDEGVMPERLPDDVSQGEWDATREAIRREIEARGYEVD